MSKLFLFLMDDCFDGVPEPVVSYRFPNMSVVKSYCRLTKGWTIRLDEAEWELVSMGVSTDKGIVEEFDLRPDEVVEISIVPNRRGKLVFDDDGVCYRGERLRGWCSAYLEEVGLLADTRYRVKIAKRWKIYLEY